MKVKLLVWLVIVVLLFAAYVVKGESQGPITQIFLPVVTNGVGMVQVPAGEFSMGCYPDTDRYGCSLFVASVLSGTVFVDDYQIDVYEVTNAEFQSCIDAGACSGYPRPLDDRAVNYVSWYDATDYCTWVDKRLPTEAEWEKAARGSEDQRSFPWGNEEPTCSMANAYLADGWDFCVRDTVSVGSYPLGVSPYGVYDMAGNVAEWTQDFVTFNSPYKVIRGGGFASTVDRLRVTDRYYTDPGVHKPNYGFRCAKSED